MIFRYHKNRKKKYIGIIHYKSGYSYFINSKIFERVVFKKTSKDIYENYKNWYKFSFVRCPFDRLLSFYKDKVLTNPIDRINRNEKKMQLCQKILLRNLNKPLKLEQFKNIKFKDICLIINKIVLSDSHFIPYNIGLINEDKIIADFVGKLENFNDDIKVINKKLKLNLQVIKDNSTFETNIFDYYDLHTIFLVAKSYEKDFKFFYPKLYYQLLNFEIMYNDKNEIIKNNSIDLNLGKKMFINKSSIKQIKNSFLNLFINYNDREYEKYKLLLV